MKTGNDNGHHTLDRRFSSYTIISENIIKKYSRDENSSVESKVIQINESVWDERLLDCTQTNKGEKFRFINAFKDLFSFLPTK